MIFLYIIRKIIYTFIIFLDIKILSPSLSICNKNRRQNKLIYWKFKQKENLK